MESAILIQSVRLCCQYNSAILGGKKLLGTKQQDIRHLLVVDCPRSLRLWLFLWSSSKCYKVCGLLFKFGYPLNFQLIGHHLNERVEQQASEIAELKALLSQKNSEVQSREEEISDLKRQLEKKDEFLKRIFDNLCSACNKKLVSQVEEMDTG